MPIYMRNTTDVKPFEREGSDVKLEGTGFHLPAAVDVQHEQTNKAVTLNFTHTGETHDLDIQLLVPAVHPNDPLG